MSSSISVLIEGNYVDAHLYGGLLLAWDDRGRLIIVSTEAVASAVAEATALPRGIARAAFVDNKLLHDPKDRRHSLDLMRGELTGRPQTVVNLRLESLDPRFFAVAPNVTVLDLMATYGRLFIATDDALFSVPFDSSHVGDLRKRLAHRCLATTPRWGVVSASCGDAGAWALLNETDVSGGPARRAEQIDVGVSVRHSWLGSSLLSFDDDNQIEMFKAAVPMRKGQRRLALGFSSIDDSDDLEGAGWWFPASDDPLGLRGADFVTAFAGLLVAARDGLVQATRISTWSGFPQPFGETAQLAEIGGRVLSVAETDGGFVVETDDELHYLTDGDPELLVDRETISLRAYPRSKRHRRAVSATVDGGLLISALLGSHPLPVDEGPSFSSAD